MTWVVRLSIVVLATVVAASVAVAGEVHVGIVPPDGWVQVDPKGTNLLAAWRDPSAKLFHTNLTFGHDDTAEPLEAYAASVKTQLGTSLPGSTPTSEKIVICGGRDAYDLIAVGRFSGVQVRIEEVVTDISGKKFIGTYTRPDDDAGSANAETSLRSICPQTE